MKKIKYGNRRNEAEPNQLTSLKQNDEICQAVLDTLNDDYLTYINHLVKHSKTPHKNRLTRDREQPSSDSQAFEKPTQQITHPQPQPHPSYPHPSYPHPSYPHPHSSSQNENNRTRHHSETAPKRNEHPKLPPKANRNAIKEYIDEVAQRCSGQKNKETVQRQKTVEEKRKKKRGDCQVDDTFFKNEQKTMSFTRNYENPFEVKAKASQQIQKHYSFKQKAKTKYYTNYQEYSETSHEKISINDNMLQNQESQRDSANYPFLNDIDNYLSHLQAKPIGRRSIPSLHHAKSREKQDREHKLHEKRKQKHIEEDFSEYDIQELLKQNLKLKKKVKSYEQKIDELEDEVSSHLIQCKNRDKHYKNKLGELIKALTQAASKINAQKTQMSAMKNLLKTFGQQVKQIQNESDETDFEEDISESIIRYMGPQKHSSEVRTKYKRGLESTLPKHEEEKKYWGQ